MRGDDRFGDIGDAAALVHRGLAQFGIGFGLAQAAGGHQDALGAIDRVALGQRPRASARSVCSRE
jgi:hypothetical protein